MGAWVRFAGCALVVAMACTTTGGETQRCRTNPECGQFRTCHVQTGTCRCADNRGCGRGEFCNSGGQCQTIAGCADNSDCESLGTGASICNVKAGICTTPDECADDSHCALGRICEPSAAQCIPGCRDEGDCLLGVGCVRETPSAPIGACVKGKCSLDAHCGISEYCDQLTGQCVFDERGPFCGACQRFDPLNPQCGDPANYCLIDTGDPSRRGHYCGVDCSQGQSCPNGYECKDVIIVGPPATPACDFEECVGGVCDRTGEPCTTWNDCFYGPPKGDCVRARVGVCAGSLDQECMSDGDCGGSEGSCLFAECRQREQSAYGFCTCVVDSDCPADDCREADLTDPAHPIAGHCLLSGHPCYEGADCDVIACVGGGCLIGRNCKPGSDRRCIDFETSMR